MPLDERNVPLPPDNEGSEDVLASRSTNRYLPPRYLGNDDSPLPSDPPGREDIMAPDPRDSRVPGDAVTAR
jgi:hypothetical protein